MKSLTWLANVLNGQVSGPKRKGNRGVDRRALQSRLRQIEAEARRVRKEVPSVLELMDQADDIEALLRACTRRIASLERLNAQDQRKRWRRAEAEARRVRLKVPSVLDVMDEPGDIEALLRACTRRIASLERFNGQGQAKRWRRAEAEARRVREKVPSVLGLMGEPGDIQALLRACTRRIEGLERLNEVVQKPLTPLPKVGSEAAYKIEVNRELILYLLHNCRPFHNGGYAVRAHGIIEGLRSWGYDIRGLARAGYPFDVIDHLGELGSEVLVDGLSYHLLNRRPANIKKMARQVYADAYFEQLCAFVEEVRPSVIHAASFHHNAHAALMVREKYGIPVIYEVRGLSVFNDVSKPVADGAGNAGPAFPTTSRFWEFREEVELARLADHLLCITEGMANLFRMLGVPDHRISVFPNGVSEAVAGRPLLRFAARKPGDPIRLGYIGSLQHYEGLEDLCEAVELLSREVPGIDFKVLIVGDGPHARVVEQRVQCSPERARFELVPRVPHEEIDEYYAKCDVMVYPRRPLPICQLVSPLKPFEPMGRGIPVIASDVAALREIVRHGETGLTFEAGSVPALAGSIRMFCDSGDLIETVRRGAKKFVQEQRNWRILTGPVADLYRELQHAASAAKRRRPKADRSDRKMRAGAAVVVAAGTPRANEFDIVELAGVPIIPELRENSNLPPSDTARLSFLADLIPLGSRVLDVGVGRGHFLMSLIKSGRARDGVGIDVAFSDGARRRLAGVPLAQMDVTQLAFADHSFDLVTCFEVIEHLDERLTAQALCHLRRVSRNRLLLSVPFEEPVPISRYHRQRFTRKRLKALFPEAKITILRKMEPRRWPWALVQEQFG